MTELQNQGTTEELAKEITRLSELLESEKFKNKMLEDNVVQVDGDKVTTLENKVAEYEDKLATLSIAMQQQTNSESDQLANLEKKVTEYEQKIAELSNRPQPTSTNDEALADAKKKINELIIENQQLKLDSENSQKDIGEVMITAKKQATKMIEEADDEIRMKIYQANKELDSIGEKAGSISEEIKNSQNDVNSIFAEVVERLSKLEQLSFDKSENVEK